MRISSALTRRWALAGLAALLGMAVAISTTSASGASRGHAVAAKKKCGKQGKKSATTAKKKKCKKKHAVSPPATTPTQPTGPVVRAEVSWTVTGVLDEADIDVHAFSGGQHTGYNEIASGDDHQIPGLTYEPGFESAHERILDTTNPSTRPLTFALCSYYYPEADPAQVTYHFVFANGSVQDGTATMLPGDIKGIDPKEGGLITLGRDKWCPAPPP